MSDFSGLQIFNVQKQEFSKPSQHGFLLISQNSNPISFTSFAYF
jgi:hypothetical protein